jgi:hypothetical protein
MFHCAHRAVLRHSVLVALHLPVKVMRSLTWSTMGWSVWVSPPLGVQRFSTHRNDSPTASAQPMDESSAEVQASNATSSSCGLSAAASLRKSFYAGLTAPIVRELRVRGIDVETMLLSDRAIHETLRDLHLLAGVFSAFVAPGESGAALLATVKRDWSIGAWTSPDACRGALFEFDGVDWAARVETSYLSNRLGRRYENVSVRLPTDGCLLRSDTDMQARGETRAGAPRLHHHGRAFYEMTPLGASVLKPICDYMLETVGASPSGADGVSLEIVYCGSEDRLDCKCVDRRAAPGLVRTLQVCFEPGWPAAPVPPNHPGPWA